MGKDIARVEVPSPKKNRLSPRFLFFFRGGSVYRKATIMDKSLWDTFACLGRFPVRTGPTPPLTPQTKFDACIQNFFRVSILYKVGEGELQENFEKDALFY